MVLAKSDEYLVPFDYRMSNFTCTFKKKFFLKNLLSFSLHIVQVLLLLFVYKCPSDLVRVHYHIKIEFEI